MIPRMRRFCLAFALLVAVSGPNRAQTILVASGDQGSVAQGHLCRSAVATAERDGGIPAHLLAAISRVESGRRDPATGAVHPWPWSVNADGQGYFYNTKAEAVAAVRAKQASGVRSIDVGCGQINLMYHPNAFPNLEMAFDPQANAAYAAKFLKALYAQTGDWMKATAMYHSATPGFGAEYQQQVQVVWPEEQRIAGLRGAAPLARAWGATMATPPPGFSRVPHMQPPDPVQEPRAVVRIAGGASPGRVLDTYPAAPIGLAYQPPPPRRAGG
jgi:Transglycosylase SLT domain